MTFLFFAKLLPSFATRNDAPFEAVDTFGARPRNPPLIPFFLLAPAHIFFRIYPTLEASLD